MRVIVVALSEPFFIFVARHHARHFIDL